MNSIIVLDSSDEEGSPIKKKRGAKKNQPPQTTPVTTQTPMARVNPVKAQNIDVMVKKATPSLANDNFKIQLPSKRPIQQNSQNDLAPEKRVRRVKPTTIVRSNDEEWIKRQNTTPQWNGGENSKATPSIISKSPLNVVKNNPTIVVKSPTLSAGPSSVRSPQNNLNRTIPTQPVVKTSTNMLRMPWNEKNPKPSSPPVVTKLKEQPKTLPIPPVINKNIIATVKDPNVPSVLSSSPVFSKNSVTIRRIVVNDDRQKAVPLAKSITQATPNSKAPIVNVNVNTPNIKKSPITQTIEVDPLKITNKNISNSSIKVTPIKTSASPTTTATPGKQISVGLKKNPSANSELAKNYQHLSTKRIESSTKPANEDPIAIVSTAPAVLVPTSTPSVKKLVNVELPMKPTTAPTVPVISKVFGSGVSNKVPNEEQPLIHLGTSMTKNQIKQPEMKSTTTTVTHKPLVSPSIINRPSGLIVTPITCNIVTTTTTTPTYNIPTNITPPTSNRSGTSKQSKTSTNRNRSALQMAAQAEQALASMFSMFPPGGFIGNSQMMYDMDPSGGAFINPACIPNRPIRTMETSTFPTVSSPGFHMNYSNFSGGSITPVMSPGPSASPTYNSGRSSKSPVTSTITRPSSATRSPASYMGISIDVDQPIPPMSPPVYNMNHTPFNGDPFNFMRNPHNIPSPSFSPVRSTRSPLSAGGPKANSKGVVESTKLASSSPMFHKDLDNFVKNPFNYPQTPNNNKSTPPAFSNGPIISLDSPPKSENRVKSPVQGESYKSSSINPISSPAQSVVSDVSSISEQSTTPNDKEKLSLSDKVEVEKCEKQTDENVVENKMNETKEEDEKVKDVEKEPLNPEFEALLNKCREVDSSEDMNKLIESKLIRYYYSVHPDFVRSRGFKKAVVAATESITKNTDLVYYHLRPVVEELKARKKSKAIVMTNDEISAVTTENEKEGIEDKVRNRQIRRLNKGLYILTRKIHKLENAEVDLEDENSTYLIVERYKKRACEIYDKICDLTGESKHALRQVKKPITFKDTEYPKFNKVLEAFVNKTREFPDFVDVLRMLEFCNDRYNFGLIKEEMTSIAQGAFIKIGKLLQSRRKADLYETVSHFTSDLEDPAEKDPLLLAKLTENEKNQTTIGSVIEKYAREQIRRKADLSSVSDDDVTNSSESGDSEEDKKEEDIKLVKMKKRKKKIISNETNKDNDKKKISKKDGDENNDKDKDEGERERECEDDDKHVEQDKRKDEDKSDETCKNLNVPTTNGIDSPPTKPETTASAIMSQSVPLASTSAAFRTSPPHAFESPEASPRPISPLLPTCTSSLKILSVTSLNDTTTTSSSPKQNNDIIKPATVVGSADEIVISDEDL